MRYDRMKKGRFLSRPNRFIAHVEIEGQEEIVHVKNTGRCAELFVPGAVVYVQESTNPQRKTKWDLIGVEKGNKMINVDSQIPNYAAKEWIEEGGLFSDVHLVKTETTYGSSRFDLYVEYGEKRAFIEVKGVTLEEEGRVRFPDAPSERAVKHVEELVKAVSEGYEAYVLFVIQMKGVWYFTPNRDTHPRFADALEAAAKAGVKVLAYDCFVTPESIRLADPVPVVLGETRLYELADPLVKWYRENKRELPWRKSDMDRQEFAYHVWVSEIMLQQTRVEAVKPYYKRFLDALPTVKDLAEAEEDKLLKLWEGLGYYNRIRNMQKAARQIMIEYHGEFPGSFEEIRGLSGIGNYTAGAISAFAFGIPKPAVDGNVLRVISRIIASDEDIMKASVRKKIEEMIEEVIPVDAPSDFNQGLIELGAIICVPNGAPKCDICPVRDLCRARELGCQTYLPVKKKEKARRIQPRTVLLFRDGGNVAIRKRPARGLLAGLYEFPGLDGYLAMDEVIAYSKSIGLSPIRVEQLPDVKHIFSHVEWHMKAYMIRVDELEKQCTEPLLFAPFEEIQKTWALPSAFAAYLPYVASWTRE